MKILAVETSCDETAAALVKFSETPDGITYTILGEKIYSQADLHTRYGGVYPTMAKREHQKILPSVLHSLLTEQGVLQKDNKSVFSTEITGITEREPEMTALLKRFFGGTAVSGVDALAVTRGPGLAPALWVGVNCVRTLAILWSVPVIPVNHLEGHIVAALADAKRRIIKTPRFPLLALLVSGGHTELVLAETPGAYRKIGKTVDDAAGEAFDKAARMLGLPYPGGPEIAKLATNARDGNFLSPATLPRPMLKDPSLNFSYAGLKTALRVLLERQSHLTDNERAAVAMEFENAVVETLIEKTKRAIETHRPKTVAVGGGVSANNHLRENITEICDRYDDIVLHLPKSAYATDNAVMIALTAALHPDATADPKTLSADANLSL